MRNSFTSCPFSAAKLGEIRLDPSPIETNARMTFILKGALIKRYETLLFLSKTIFSSPTIKQLNEKVIPYCSSLEEVFKLFPALKEGARTSRSWSKQPLM